MYRTNHFNSCNFPIRDLGNAQGAVREVDACADPRIGILFPQLFQKDVPQRLVLLIGKIEMDEPVDASHFLAGTEENLVGEICHGQGAPANGEGQCIPGS